MPEDARLLLQTSDHLRAAALRALVMLVSVAVLVAVVSIAAALE